MEFHGWMLRWLLNALGVIIIILLVPEAYTQEGYFNYGFAATIWAALIGAIFIGIANAVVVPLFGLVHLPFNYVNLAIISIIFNALVLPLTVATIRGFDLSGWAWWILVVLFMSAVSFVSSLFIPDREYRMGG